MVTGNLCKYVQMHSMTKLFGQSNFAIRFVLHNLRTAYCAALCATCIFCVAVEGGVSRLKVKRSSDQCSAVEARKRSVQCEEKETQCQDVNSMVLNSRPFHFWQHLIPAHLNSSLWVQLFFHSYEVHTYMLSYYMVVSYVFYVNVHIVRII